MRTIFILLFITNISFATNYYVSGSGSNSNNGTSPSTPFLTIKYAHGFTNPGDTVWIMNGTYTPVKWDHVVKITRSGKIDSLITYKAYPGHQPLIHVTKDKNCWAAIKCEASYITFEGLELMGDNDNITMLEADSVYTHYKTATVKDWGFISNTNTNGIYVEGPVKNEPGSRNVIIKNCLIHKFPGGGIAVERADYVTIENNTVHSNAWYMIWAGSGISIFHPYDADSNFTSYKNIVRNNICYRNECYIKWADYEKYSDGNGIIIDDTKNSQISKAPYKGKSLVVNNLSYLNGGGGINIYSSENVDVYNNTTYGNSQSPHLDYANLGGVSNTNVNFYNNIAYALKNTDFVNAGNYQNINVVYRHNIFFNGIISTVGSNNITANPMFINIDSLNFKLSAGSPAIDVANVSFATDKDILNVSRLIPDIGAYEYINPAALPIRLIDFKAKVIDTKVELYWKTAYEKNNDFFTVEKSVNGYNWEIVNTVSGAGNSYTVLSYSAFDNKPYFGNCYYRLKQTDFDGKHDYSNVTAVNVSKHSEINMTIYPNPASTILYVLCDHADYTVEVMNMLQNTILTAQNANQIDVSNFMDGTYFIRIFSPYGNPVTRKLIIQK